MHWISYSMISTVAFGVMTALYKIPHMNGHSKFIYTFTSFAVATILSFLFFFSSINLDSKTVAFGAVWGIIYALLTLKTMQVFTKIDASTVSPITTTASQFFVLIIGLSFFHDKLSLLQLLGMLLSFVIIVFYNGFQKHLTIKNGLLLGASIMVMLSATLKFVQKFGSISVEIKGFIFWQLFFSMLSSFFILIYIERKNLNKGAFDFSSGRMAILMGALNFVGTASIVKVLSIGTFSLVYAVNSFYVLVTSVVAWIFFKEKMTTRKIIFLLLAIGTIILMRIG